MRRLRNDVLVHSSILIPDPEQHPDAWSSFTQSCGRKWNNYVAKLCFFESACGDKRSIVRDVVAANAHICMKFAELGIQIAFFTPGPAARGPGLRSGCVLDPAFAF